MDRKDKELQKRLLAIFEVEAAEHVQALSSGLLALERAPGVRERMTVLEGVFREAHSLKGAARAVGLTGLETVCHSMEGVLAALKRNELELSQPLLNALIDVTDALGRYHPTAGDAAVEHDGLPTQDLLRRLESVSRRGAAPIPRQTRKMKAAATAQEPVQKTSPTPLEERSALAGTVRIPAARLDSLLLQAEELLSAKLSARQRVDDVRGALAELALLKKERAKAEPIRRALRPVRGSDGRRTASDRDDSPWRVLQESAAREAGLIKSVETKLEALARSAAHDQRSLGVMVDGLLEDMKKALMLPLSSCLDVFPKLVRELARDQGKEVDLVVRGGELEVDRRILEELRDPLIHLVRNGIDHGIEPPAVRERKSKPRRGVIALDVAPKNGSRIEILVSDDGAGIDLAKVRDAARRLGLTSPADAEGGEERDLLPLVFVSGVSTSPIITDVSGRGLGLAIVWEKVERLGGAVSVETRPGGGTTFRIVLPLTLATFHGVRVRVSDRQFILPTTHVEQVVRVDAEAVKTVENRETIPWQGQPLALVRLADVLELPRRRGDDGAGAGVQALILGGAGRRIAFGVDETLGEQEVLVRTLGKQLSRVRNIAGATVLGDGKVVPILNVPDLLRSAVNVAASAREVGEVPAAAAAPKAILVVEDSITSRALLKGIVEAAGYDVITAVDGVDALTHLKTRPIDLVVSDVEMPRMDGFDLTARIRADKALGELPVVLVTALESREHRERGIDVGANAYVVKSSFDQSNLLDIIRRLV